MEKILEILERKNLCFKNFFQISQKLLLDLEQGNIETLDNVQQQRKSLISVLEHLDKELVLETPKPRPAELEQKVQELQRIKNEVLKKILDLDAVILGRIQTLKTETVHRLQAVQSSRRTIGAYRSPQEYIDHHTKKSLLDEEA